MSEFKTVEFTEGKLRLIDQTKLPLKEEYIITDDPERIAVAIEKLEVRGAPAIGVAAAYGLALALKNYQQKDDAIFYKTYERLASTRPTAVNLFYALDEIKRVYEAVTDKNENIYNRLIKEAIRIHEDDINLCDSIANNGLGIFSKPVNVLTHCNAGQLATGGGGTAVYVIRKAYENGFVKHVYSDETRPLLQGSRLTAFELDKAGIPFSVLPDSAAATLMKEGKVDVVITGADRIACNGDSANKIGTYMLAVLCKHHGIPFYIAAPETTIDREIKSGSEIKIEYRSGNEVTSVNGSQITKKEYPVVSPAFDVTPAELITGIITDKTIYKYPYNL